MPKRVFSFKSAVPSSWLNLIENHTHSDPTAEGDGGSISSAVTAIASPLISTRIGSTGPAGCRNLIRNPRFAVNQRNVSGTVTLSAGAYGHDGWKAGASGCTYTFSTTQNRTTLNITAGSLVQTVDGLDLAAGANTYTLSWGGTCQGKIGAGSYGASGVTGSATGGTNINVEFGAGTLYEPQFERGTVASEFDFRDFDTELRRCRIYLPGVSITGATGGRVIASGYAPNAGLFAADIPIDGARGVPTGVIITGTFAAACQAVQNAATSGSLSAASSGSIGVVQFTSSGLPVGSGGYLLATSTLASILFTGLEI